MFVEGVGQRKNGAHRVHGNHNHVGTFFLHRRNKKLKKIMFEISATKKNNSEAPRVGGTKQKQKMKNGDSLEGQVPQQQKKHGALDYGGGGASKK